jgi:putative Mg2+ transporter-C (MgtC) family protein
MEMIRRSGQQGVPVITTDDEVIVGFDQARLKRLVDMYGPPKRPALGLLAADAEQYLSRHPEAAAGLPEGTKGIFVGEVRPGSVAEKAGHCLPGKASRYASCARARTRRPPSSSSRFPRVSPILRPIEAEETRVDTLSTTEVILRTAAALAAGAVIGLEREWSDKPAGIRTYALVCQGAALFMIVGILLMEHADGRGGADPTRIASTVVQGIGFLAGGVIFTQRAKVQGLTTAAGIWVTAAVGLLLGGGYYHEGAIAVAAAIFVLVPMRWVERSVFRNVANRTGSPPAGEPDDGPSDGATRS